MVGDHGQYGVRGYLTAQDDPETGALRPACGLLGGMLRAELLDLDGQPRHQIRMFVPIAVRGVQDGRLLDDRYR